MNVRSVVACALSLVSVAAFGSPAVGTVVQGDLRAPMPWRELSATERAQFDLGHAIFNTQWSAALETESRTDGLGPVFNVPSCDACHNSRRRGRGPRDSGEAPADLVIQLGRALENGTVERGTAEYGHVLNTAAMRGIQAEAFVNIRYTERIHRFRDGTSASLRIPTYELKLSGPALPSTTVVMPRMPSPLFGVGLLERVPQPALLSIEKEARRKNPSARLSRLDGTALIGRFGWQATEPTVASQTASAFGREMGLTTTLLDVDDCGMDAACRNAPNGGTPEVDAALFDALIAFQSLHAVPVANGNPNQSPAAKLFERLGCAECHRPTLPVEIGGDGTSIIGPFTDLLLHDLGESLADREVGGKVVPSAWRTAPLWGMNAAVESNQPLRLLHDGRARSIEEAILWHGGAGAAARTRYEHLNAAQRRALVEWIEQL